MQKEFPQSKYEFLRYFIGDVRDLYRLKRAFQGIEVVVHAAALSKCHQQNITQQNIL